MNVDTSDKNQQRSFGIVMAAAITVLGLIRWALRGGEPPMTLFYVALAFLATGLAVPRVLRPILVVWLKFSLALNWVMTRVLLTVAFFGMIVPTRVIIRLFSDDPLNRKWDPEATTYWEEAEEQPSDFRRYFNQF